MNGNNVQYYTLHRIIIARTHKMMLCGPNAAIILYTRRMHETILYFIYTLG
ncbi:hypothetical protein HZS_1392 [Henneguya salminicola]|nr:hypothetical protein HZS_1392 [Henneguya salminicola]